VPFTSFAEPTAKGNAWFALDYSEPLAFFAGIWVPQWKSVRKLKEGETVSDLFAFLTTEPNAEVKPIHPKAMPVILATEQDQEAWLAAEWAEAKTLQHPLPDGSLKSITTEALPARGKQGEP
jgi:putative SOS response-associated peptidase YedK